MISIDKKFLYLILTLLVIETSAQKVYTDTVRVVNNNLRITFGNDGTIADFSNGSIYDEGCFLYSAGFELSGYNRNDLWVCGSFSINHDNDFQPGAVDTDPEETRNKFYVLRRSDDPFGESWRKWMEAVEQGAEYYDGDKNGQYNPIDVNYNGRWDANEDRPDLLGDYTAWCIYNDAVPYSLLTEPHQPLGIEIQQSIFSASNSTVGPHNNIIFIRYVIRNTGKKVEQLDSVIFASIADADIGYWEDDLTGCDTAINSIFSYNNLSDSQYGSNPPSFLIELLQGPHSYIPNITFSDENNNQIFEPKIDIPLDSAIYNKGSLIGKNIISGAKNLKMSAHRSYIADIRPRYSSMRYFMEGGKDLYGEPLDVCSYHYGNGSDLENCKQIDNRFMYSGDPVTGTSWLNVVENDYRNILSTGSFTLKVDEPVEIIVAYIVGRGADELKSITVAKDIARYAKETYDNNFDNLPVGINEEETSPNSYSLAQNHPNPFNPSTTISYSIPDNGKVSLKVYDILGKEVVTLVNETREPGLQNVDFNASTLPSGVYIYTLRVNNYMASKKMLLIK